MNIFQWILSILSSKKIDWGLFVASLQGWCGAGKCPVMGGSHKHTATGSTANQHWWPNQLNLRILQQNSPLTDPMGEATKKIQANACLLKD